MAIRSDATLWAWGRLEGGKLGITTTITDLATPTRVPDLLVTAVSVGQDHVLALDTQGRVWSWGGNAAGTLGDGSFNSRVRPAVVEGLPTIVRISAGARHSLAVDSAGRVWGWGAQESGQLCNKPRASAPGPDSALRPVLLSVPAGGVAIVAAAGSRSVFLGQDGSVSVCGASDQSAVCHDVVASDGVAVTSLQRLAPLDGSVRAFANAEATYTISRDGRVASCGSNSSGELGKGIVSGGISTPAYLSTVANITEGAAGNQFAIVVRRDGAVFAWGDNSLGQLGVSAAGGSSGNPVQVRTISGPLSLGIDPDADPDGDGAPNEAELAAGTDPFTRDNAVLGETEFGYQLFTRQQYRDFLVREATTSEAATAAVRIVNQLATRPSVVDDVLKSAEFDRTTGAISRLYFATYQRAADRGGLRFWTGELRRGTSFVVIATAFTTAPEFAATYGNLNNRQYVERLYLNVLGRSGDVGGIAFWTAEVDAGRISRGGLLAAFSESGEFRARSAASVAIATVYSAMLGRNASQQEFDAWVTALGAADNTIALISGAIASGEYAARFLP